jgi:hypothetical protein
MTFLSDSQSLIRSNFQALEFLQLLILRNQIDDAWAFICRLTRPMAGVEAVGLELWFYVLVKVVEFRKNQTPMEPKAGVKKRLIVTLPVWGIPYVDVWTGAGAHFLQQEAWQALAKSTDIVLYVFTEPLSRGRLRSHPAMRDLEARFETRYFNIAPVLARYPKKMLVGMNVAHWASLSAASAQHASLLTLFADTLYSTGSAQYLVSRILAAEHAALFTIDLQLNVEAWAHLREPDSGVQTNRLTSDVLRQLFLTNPARRERAWTIDLKTGRIPLKSCRISFATPEGRDLRTLCPQPLYLSASLVRDFVASSPLPMDGCTVDIAMAALGGTERMAILNDPNAFLCATVDMTEDGHTGSTLTADEPVDAYLKVLSEEKKRNATRRWAFSQGLVIGNEVGPSPFDEILRRFHERPSNASDAVTAYLRLKRDAILPAFDATVAGASNVRR